MAKPVVKRRRRPRLSVDPAEHRSRIQALATAEERPAAYIILKLANERLDQLLAENQVPPDKIAFISSDGSIQLFDTWPSNDIAGQFMQSKYAGRLLADGRRILLTANRKPVNVRASLVLNQQLAGPIILGPASLIPVT